MDLRWARLLFQVWMGGMCLLSRQHALATTAGAGCGCCPLSDVTIEQGKITGIACSGKHLAAVPTAEDLFGAFNTSMVSVNLTYNLSRNSILSVRNIDFSWLRGKTIAAIDLSRNLIYIIEDSAFSGIILDKLDLSSNAIVGLGESAFADLTFAELLLSNNQLTDPCVISKSKPKIGGDWWIRMQGNNISLLRPKCLQLSGVNQTTILLSADLSNNRLSSFSEEALVNSNVKYLDLSGNNISDGLLVDIAAMFARRSNWVPMCSVKLMNNTLKDISVLCNLSLSLQYSLDANLIAYVPSGCFSAIAMNNGTVVKLTNNSLTSIVADFFYNLDSVTDCQLQNNLINGIHRDTFIKLTALESLNLSWNQLGKVDSLCLALPKLRQIDLSNNYITSVHDNCFEKLTSLTTLLLAGNRIVEVAKESFATGLSTLELQHNLIARVLPGTFVKLHALRRLNIAWNNLTFLNPIDFNTSMAYFAFSGNPFNCSCELSVWLSDYAGVNDFSDTKCLASGSSNEMGDFLINHCITQSAAVADGTRLTGVEVTGVVVGLTLLLIGILAGLCLAWRRRRGMRNNFERVTEDADHDFPSFRDIQHYKFVPKSDRLHLITTSPRKL